MGREIPVQLLQGTGPLFSNKIFLVSQGVRHWITHIDWFSQNGYFWPSDIVLVPDNVLRNFKFGRPASRSWRLEFDRPWSANDQLELREMGCSFVHGDGIEFGAASNPLPIPLDAHVSYADIMTYEELVKNRYPGQLLEEIIEPSIMADLSNLAHLGKVFDFIAAAHVIEHLSNPIRAICEASHYIRENGHLVLFVPDMTKTFDKDRAITEIEHLIEDFYFPSRSRDKEHFREFYKLAFPVSPEVYEETWHKSWVDDFPIHFHTWTYETFDCMIRWIIENFGVYKSYTSHATCGNEFCFVLKK